MEHDEANELTAAYALHALEPADERDFEDHLARCEWCRTAVAEFEEVGAALAYDVDAPAPPSGLRDRILTTAMLERPNVVPLRPRWTLTTAAALAAVAACAAIALGVWAAVLHSNLSDERAARAAEQRATAVLASADARHLALSGGHGTLVVTPNGDAAMVVRNLQPAPDGHVYEAWVIANGKPRPAGVFRAGRGAAVIPLTRPVPAGAVVAVTLEAVPVDAPTGQPVFQSQSA